MYWKRAPKARAKILGFYRGTVCDIISFKFHGRRYSAPFPADAHEHGRPQKIFQSGAKPTTPKKVDCFSVRRSRKRKIFALLRHFRLWVRVFIASAEGASENVRVFHRRAAYDVIFFKFHEGCGQVPPLLRAPMPMGACSLISKFCFSQQLHPKFNINKASPWNFLGQAQILVRFSH